ncbi:2943_t:CDS:2, partial [Funneliformis geosporum]
VYLIEKRIDTVKSYLSDKDILISLKTGRGKTFCYAVCALIFKSITIVISWLKALIEDQKTKLNKVKYLRNCSWIPKKLCLNKEFQYFISNIYNKAKEHFVIDEAHCVLNYSSSRIMEKSRFVKKNWTMVTIMLLTATTTHKDAQDIFASLRILFKSFSVIRVLLLNAKNNYKGI